MALGRLLLLGTLPTGRVNALSVLVPGTTDHLLLLGRLEDHVGLPQLSVGGVDQQG